LMAALVSAAVSAVVPYIMRLINPPQVPAPMPTELTGKTDAELREEARQELGIDSVNCFNFGFAGNRGTGKSSLINAIRNIDDSSPDSAQVDEVECTDTIKSYDFPDMRHIVLWDIPGAGTVKHKASTYFEDKKLYAFDMILIIGASGFSESDIAIALAANRFNVPIVFVRSKSDNDIDSLARRVKKPKKDVKDEVKLKIISDIRKQLPSEVQDREVFVVSSRVIGPPEPDFDKTDYLLDELNLVQYVQEVAHRRRNN